MVLSDRQKHASPADLEAWDRQHYWHAFTQMAEYQPLIIERASGCWLYDAAGNRYLDGVSSLWCNVHGHRHPRLDEAVREQLERVAHVTSLGASNDTTIRLTRRLAEVAPGDLNHVFFSSDGSSAVEVALKLAFQYWRQIPHPEPERNTFIALEQAYHGDTLGSVSVGCVPLFHEMFRPLLFDVLRLPIPCRPRPHSPLTEDEAARQALQRLEAELQRRGHEVAAIIVEPRMQAAAGMRLHPAGYLHGVRALATQYNVLMIADEVAVGFGRSGRLFACQTEDVAPDLLCLGKGLTGGYLPMAATLASDRIWDAFLGDYSAARTFFHGHTYGGNPLAAAVALASLDVFEEERVLEGLAPKIARLAQHLEQIRELPFVGDVRQCGMLAGIELSRDPLLGVPFPWGERRGHRVCEYALSQEVFLRPLGNVIVVVPPLAISLEELDQLMNAVAAGIQVATGDVDDGWIVA